MDNEDSPKSGNDKTSLAFSLYEDRPGGLFWLLGIFARENINLTKIESRPSKEGLGHYIFFVDFEGHRMDGRMSEILEELDSKTSFFKVLGSYPIYSDELFK